MNEKYTITLHSRISVTDQVEIKEQSKSMGTGDPSTYIPKLKGIEFSCRKIWRVWATWVIGQLARS